MPPPPPPPLPKIIFLADIQALPSTSASSELDYNQQMDGRWLFNLHRRRNCKVLALIIYVVHINDIHQIEFALGKSTSELMYVINVNYIYI